MAELEPAEPVPTVAEDPDFDDWRFLPFVREHGRDVPWRLSAHYAEHKRAWGRLPARQKLDDLRRLLPKVKALRKHVDSRLPADLPPELLALGLKPGDERDDDFTIKNISDVLRWKDFETADDVLLRDIIADVRWLPRFWFDLRERDTTGVVEAVERACRPGLNRKAGNKPGNLRTEPPTPSEKLRIRARKKELLPQIVEAKKWVLRGRRQKDLDLQHKALERFKKIARSIRSTLDDERILGPIGIYFDKASNTVPVKRKPIEIVWYLIAKEFNTTIPHVRHALSRR